MILCRNLNILNDTIYSFIRGPSKDLAEPLGYTELGLKKTAVRGEWMKSLTAGGQKMTISVAKKA